MNPPHVQHQRTDIQTDQDRAPPMPSTSGSPVPVAAQPPLPTPSLGGSSPQQGASTLRPGATLKKAPKVAQLTPNCPTAGVCLEPPPRPKSAVGQGGCKGQLGAGCRERGARDTQFQSPAVTRRVVQWRRGMPGRLGSLTGGGQKPESPLRGCPAQEGSPVMGAVGRGPGRGPCGCGDRAGGGS